MELFSAVSAIIIVQVMATIWLKARITSSIKHEYDRKLEDYKQDVSRREKAALVAELVAEWTHPMETTKRLNQLLWELSLYLPSKLVVELNGCVSKSPGSKTSNEVLVMVRDYLLDGEDPISPRDIRSFKDPNNPNMVLS